MKALLESFFQKIAQFDDTQVIELEKGLYACLHEDFKDYAYQADFIRDVLLGYGLPSVVEFSNYQDTPAIFVDFNAKWEENLERSSQIFLKNVPYVWERARLDQYAASVEELGLEERFSKLATNALLLLNLSRDMPNSFHCKAELTPSQDIILTFGEPKQATVFYVNDEEVRTIQLGRYASAFYQLIPHLINVFVAQKEAKLDIEVDNTLQTIGLNDLQLNKTHIDTLLAKDSRVFVSTKRTILTSVQQLINKSIEMFSNIS
jgi:hypothetical protein